MQNINPYLTFQGNCREAMEFYQLCLNGEITSMETFADVKMEVPEAFKNKIVHAVLRAEGIHLMASDGMPGFVADPGNVVSLSMELTDRGEQERIFNALAAGGKITMPLAKMFWGGIYGRLTDRFGIQWQFNCSVEDH